MNTLDQTKQEIQDQVAENFVSIADWGADILGRMDFIAYVVLGSVFVVKDPKGGVYYDRERHLKAYNLMENDFQDILINSDPAGMPEFPPPDTEEGEEEDEEEKEEL